MKILAIDTSAVCASVAVTDGERVLSESSINTGLTHSRTLMPMIDSALKNGEISLGDIDMLACSAGPGSFTGIRIGVAAIKGLGDGLGIKCIPVSTLEGLAYNLAGQHCTAACVMDARCNQVYCALFSIDGQQVERLTEDMAIKIEELEKMLPSYENVVFVGDGAMLCHKALGYSLAAPGNLFQRGSSVALAALKSPEKAVAPSELMPVYLRLPQAERELRAKQLSNK